MWLLANLKPILGSGINELGETLNTLAKDGRASLEEFKKQYKTLSEEMHMSLEEQFNSQQLHRLEDYNRQRKVKIEQALFMET